jgi:hypothetical protein
LAFSKKLASVLSLTGLIFFGIGFIIHPNATILIMNMEVNPFVLLGFLLLGTGLIQPLFEKMKNRI